MSGVGELFLFALLVYAVCMAVAGGRGPSRRDPRRLRHPRDDRWAYMRGPVIPGPPPGPSQPMPPPPLLPPPQPPAPVGRLPAVVAELLLYEVGAAVFGRRRRRLHRRLWRRLGLDEWDLARATSPARGEGAPSPSPQANPLPVDVQVKVEQIRRKVEVLKQHAGRFPVGSRDLYILQRTATDYLPATLDAFAALPPDLAGRSVAPDGRTGLQVLKDQLALLDAKLDEIAEDVQRQDVDRLLANGRFLEEHFGRPPEDLTLPRQPS